MEAKALYAFGGTETDELPFRKDSIVKIIGQADNEHWLKAEFNGKEGIIPANYVEYADPPWYIRDVSRAKAETILKAEKQDGTFLVRNSESSPGDFSISVKFENGIQHFKVLRDGSGKYFLWLVKFDSINQLVHHHHSNSVSKEQRILLVRPPQGAKKVLRVVHAIFDFAPQESGELSLKKGDRIEVTDETDKNWWTGKNLRTNEQGLFPVPYIQS